MSTTIGFDEIEALRKRWKPEPVAFVEIEGNDTVKKAIDRSLILGLFLELPVGQWVGQATKKELNCNREVLQGLGKNIADEAVHLKALEYVCDAFNISPDTHGKEFEEAGDISQAWLDLDLHPLLKAACAEVGVFLPNLSLMTILGGQSISDVAISISRDEQRHGVYNRGVLNKIGIDLSQETPQLKEVRRATLNYIFQGVEDDDLGLDEQFFMEESQNLIQTGYSRNLEEFTSHFVYSPAFEKRNKKLY